MSTKIQINIQRFNPDTDNHPRLDTFTVEATPETTILDALEQIKSEQDGSLTFRRSCRHAICGSCAMNINGKNTLVCNSPLMKYGGKARSIDYPAVAEPARYQGFGC